MKRTLKNCKIIKQMRIVPRQVEDKCMGFGAQNGDEPHEECKRCKLNENWESDK